MKLVFPSVTVLQFEFGVLFRHSVTTGTNSGIKLRLWSYLCVRVKVCVLFSAKRGFLWAF